VPARVLKLCLRIFSMHYESAPLMEQKSMGDASLRGLCPRTPRISRFGASPDRDILRAYSERGCRSIPLYRSRPLSPALGLLPSMGPILRSVQDRSYCGRGKSCIFGWVLKVGHFT
jgi:hypothetical protein